MAVWKRVLTTADTTNNNLASTNLEVPSTSDATFERKFTMPSASASSGLVFEGYMKYGGYANVVRPMLRVENQYNNDTTDHNYVYAAALRVGSLTSTTVNGRENNSGYLLPQYDQDDDGGKILITGDNWTTGAGETEFKTFAEAAGPDGEFVEGSFSDDSLLFADDSLLVYRNGAEEYKHLKLKHFPRSYYLQVGRNGTLGNGSFWMRGVNGVELNNEDFDIGLVVAEDCNLVRLTAGWRKQSGGVGHQRQVKIWVNGTYVGRTAYFGNYNNNFDYVTETFTTFVLPNNNTVVNGFALNAGDTISFQYYNAGAYPGQGTHFQVNALLNTVTD